MQVRARNSQGTGAYSPSATATPNEKPGRPAAPTVSAASGASLRVSWTAPTNNGTAITDYDLQYKLSSSSSWTSHAFAGTGTAATIGGLTAGATYNVQVRAANTAGESTWSASGSGTPNEKPGRPAAPTAAAASATSLSVSWTAPTNNGTAITDYDVRYKRSSASSWTSHAFAGTGTATTIGSLTTGAVYNVEVRAGNAAGEGAWSPSGTGTPNEKPGHPAAPTASAASGSSLSVSWTAPTNNGTAITDYDVRYKRSSASSWTSHAFAGTGTATTIGSLTTGAVYNVEVRAGNAAGEGAWSPSGTGTPNEKPGHPAAPTASAASGSSLSVSWTAPTNNGTAITDYDVRYKRSSASSWTSHAFAGTGTATTIGGLTAGAVYNVQVHAGNAAGEGDWSPSGTGTPNETPGRPAAPSVACAGVASMRVSWTAPASDCGAITDYDVRYKRSSSSGWTNHAFAGTGTATTIGSLTTGAVHNVEVRAGNAAGEGAWSPSGSGTPNAKPGRPAAPSVASAGAASLRVSWTAPANTGTAITDYDVRYKRSSASSWTSHSFAGVRTSTTIAGLTTGTAYDAQVRAGNAAGEGPWSPSGSGTPRAVPDRPSAPTVSAASATSLRVSWTAPASGGSAITDYDVRYKRSSASTWTSHRFAGTGTSTTITGLATGRAHDVQVRAGNASGEGDWSPSGTGTPNNVPGRPSAPTVVARSGTELNVSWRSPRNTGSAITDYDVRYKLSTAASWTDHPFSGVRRHTTIGSLTAGRDYNAQVRASNAVGTGGWSASGSGKPNEPPGQPAAPTVRIASGTSLAVSWTAPTNGGTPITGYDVGHRANGASAWRTRAFAGTRTSTTIAGLTAATRYSVRVRAGNAAGKGGWSASASGTPNEKPGRMAAPTVAPASTSTLSVSWSAPTNNGTVITGYDVRHKLATATSWTERSFAATTTAATIADLTTGSTYNVQARAGNAAGKGDWSASGSGAPADVPRFSAEYHSGSHAIVLKFKGCPRNICNGRVAFYEIEETFNDGTATPARSSGAEHRRLNPANGAYRFRARYCTFDDTEQVKSCGVWSAAVHETVSRTGPFAPEPALVTTTVPGDLPFDVGVTKGGDAYVNIPIAPAPGVNGLAPRLTIDYGGGRERQRLAEHQPADILGYGWRVGGLSAIHRCVKNRTGANVLTFTSRDGLCLDGEPLVLVSGTAMTAGAEYRTYRESFVKVLAKGAGASLWFEAKLPGGGARQYGNTTDSRLLFHHPRSSTGDNLIWSLNRETDSFGNAAVYEYHEDERASVRHPKRIRYGVDNDAELLFEYTSRADAETVSMAGGARTRHLLLHTVKARLDGRDVREYRLLSETTSAGWRRLDKVQLCAYGESGAASSRQCLRHLEVDWVNTTIAAAGYKTCVNRLEAPMGRVTAFEYGTIRNTGTHSFLFAERPFGEPGTLANTEALPAASDGAIKPVVTAMTREDGVGGTRRASYAYQGKGLCSTANWGFLGFPATRVTDSTSDVVVYRQFRMDAPHFGALAAEHRYHRAYGDASRKTLSKRLVEYAEATFAHGTATTRLPHRRRETVVHYENDVALGATRTEWGRAHAGNLPTRATSTVTVGTGNLGTLAAGSAWGTVPAYSFTAKKREWKTTTDLENRTLGASWLVGFVCQSAEEHFKDGSATADRKRWTTRVPRANGMEPASESAFAARAAGCAGATDHGDSASLKLTTTRAYDSRGNPTSVATRSELAGHVPRRAAGASNFVDGRYPGRLANPLGHAATVAYDARFGTPKSVTDANGRTTRVARDPSGGSRASPARTGWRPRRAVGAAARTSSARPWTGWRRSWPSTRPRRSRPTRRGTWTSWAAWCGWRRRRSPAPTTSTWTPATTRAGGCCGAAPPISRTARRRTPPTGTTFSTG